MALRTPNPGSPQNSRGVSKELLLKVNEEVGRLLRQGLSSYVNGENYNRFWDNIFKVIKNSKSNEKMYNSPLKIVLTALVETLSEMFEEAKSHYEELVREGVPRVEEAESIISQVPKQIDSIRRDLSKADNTGTIDIDILKVRIFKALFDVNSLVNVNKNIIELKDIIMKITRGESITWSEAKKLSVFYDYEILYKYVEPKSITLPPIGTKVLKYIEPFTKFGWYILVISFFKDRVEIRNESDFVIGFKLDEEAPLPDGVREVRIYINIDKTPLDKLLSDRITIEVGKDGFAVKGYDASVEIYSVMDDSDYELDYTSIREGRQYTAIEFTKETGVILSRLSDVLRDIIISSTGHILDTVLIKDLQSPFKLIVLSPNITKMRRLETTTDKVFIMAIYNEVGKLFATAMKILGRGKLKLIEDPSRAIIEFRDEEGVNGYFISYAYLLQIIEKPVKVEEVDMVKIKPNKYLAEFVDRFVEDNEKWPVMVNYNGEILVAPSENYLFITRGSVGINKPVKIDLSLFWAYWYIKAGLIPVTSLKDKGVEEEANRVITGLYEEVRNREPDVVVLYPDKTFGEVPEELSYVLDEAYWYARSFNVRRNTRINIYDLGSTAVIEIQPRKDVKMLFKVKK